MLSKVEPEKPETKFSLLDFRPNFRNRKAMGYILAYGAHSWELFAFRSWLVVFLVFSLSLQSFPDSWPSPTVIATISALVAVFASIIGNELAEKFGRRRVIYCFLVSSGCMGIFSGFQPDLPYWIVALLMLVYSGLIQLDSAALTAGAIASSDQGRKGSTLGLHALVGFGGAAIGPLVFGVVLDFSGGLGEITAWGFAFMSMGIIALLGPLGLWLYRERI